MPDNEYRLTQEILRRSVSQTWNEAKAEWELVNVAISPIHKTCLCGHAPIKEICTIVNSHNREKVEVGNVCVDQFIGLRSGLIFDAIKRVQDGGKSLNLATIDFAFKQTWIDKYEYDFYVDKVRKQKLNEKQEAFRQKLNQRILRFVIFNHAVNK